MRTHLWLPETVHNQTLCGAQLRGICKRWLTVAAHQSAGWRATLTELCLHMYFVACVALALIVQVRPCFALLQLVACSHTRRVAACPNTNVGFSSLHVASRPCKCCREPDVIAEPVGGDCCKRMALTDCSRISINSNNVLRCLNKAQHHVIHGTARSPPMLAACCTQRQGLKQPLSTPVPRQH